MKEMKLGTMAVEGVKAQAEMIEKHDEAIDKLAGQTEDLENEMESYDAPVIVENKTFWAMYNAWRIYAGKIREASEKL
jgi:hypothetical protein